LASNIADTLFTQLTQTLNWKQDEMRIAGKVIPIPRLQAWYGDAESQYGYSGISLPPLSWTSELLEIKEKIESVTQCRFNSVLANYYRDGKDSVAWHQDNEPELGHNPVIASLSLGETRQFQLRHTTQKYPTIKLNLPHNALLLMSGDTQTNWYHQIPKTKKMVGPRINLTFRLIKR
jgi:alkylated DNA repair dioxygenase AlkB